MTMRDVAEGTPLPRRLAALSTFLRRVPKTRGEIAESSLQFSHPLIHAQFSEQFGGLLA